MEEGGWKGGKKGSFSRFGPVIWNIIALCFRAARKQTKTVLLINSSMEENINDAFFHAIFKFVITTKTLFYYLTRCPTL